MTTERILYLIAFIGLNLATIAYAYYQGVTHGLDQVLRILRNTHSDNNQ